MAQKSDSPNPGAKVSYVGVISSIGLILFGIILIWRNETTANVDAYTYPPEFSHLIRIQSDRVDPNNEGRLVYTTGLAESHEVLTDPLTGLSLKAIRLSRDVEMYQWKEVKKRGGAGEPELSYMASWSMFQIPSEKFADPNHKNPAMPFHRKQFTAKEVRVGAFRPGGNLLANSLPLENVTVDETAVQMVSNQFKNVKSHQNSLYLGEDPTHPRVGDVRIRYRAIRDKVISIIGVQHGNGFIPFVPQKNLEFLFIAQGRIAPEAILGVGQQGNVKRIWFMRLIASVMIWGGVSSLLALIYSVSNPFSMKTMIEKNGYSIVGAVISLPLIFYAEGFSMLTTAPATAIFFLFLGTGILGLGYYIFKRIRFA
jgi:hypothetical protein